MKKFFLLLVSIVFITCTIFTDDVNAAKNKDSLKLKARDGGNIIYGSVLNSKENEVRAKLQKAVLKAVRQAGVENISVSITQLAEEGKTSNIYTLNPADSVDLFGKTLVINLLAALTDVAGSTYTAGALPEGNYELTIIAGTTTVKGNFEYKPPVVVVGNVTGESGSCSGGTNQINNLSGDSLSRTVALSNCSYFNEVPASRTSSNNKSRSRKLLQTAEETPAETETPSEEPDIAISQAVTPEEILLAPVELNSENNGEVQYDINPNTTEIVENALGLIAGGDELSEEDLELAEDILKDEVRKTSLEEEIEGVVKEGEGELEEFEPAPGCDEKLIALLDSFPEKPTKDELLALGTTIVSQIESGELKDCLPKFVSEKIVPAIKQLGNEGLISFAEKFIFHLGEFEDELRGIAKGPDVQEICSKLKEGLGFLKECKGKFCPPPPCFPDKIRSLLKEGCPELLTLVPETKCQEGPRPCNIKGPPPGSFGPPPGGGFGPPGFIRKAQSFPTGGEDGCIEFKQPEKPNFCAPCSSDDECHGPKEKDPNAMCDLPTIACITFKDFEGNEKKACHLNGKPKDPFSCKEFPGPDPALQCLGPPPVIQCLISNDGVVQGRFDKRCCGFGPKGPGFGPKFQIPGDFGPPPGDFTGGFGPPEGFGFPEGFQPPEGSGPPEGFGEPGGEGSKKLNVFCVREKLCSNLEGNFEQGEVGKLIETAVQTAIEGCQSEVSAGHGPGGGGKPKPGFIDCNDPQFAEAPECKPKNGFIDCNDPKFAEAPECKPKEGFIDCKDPKFAESPECKPKDGGFPGDKPQPGGTQPPPGGTQPPPGGTQPPPPPPPA